MLKSTIVFTGCCAILAGVIGLTGCGSAAADPRQPQVDATPAAVRLYNAEGNYAHVDKFCDGGRAVYVATYDFKAISVAIHDGAPECVR